MELIKKNRQFMKSNFKGYELEKESDMAKKCPKPALQKEVETGTKLIDLPEVKEELGNKDLFSCVIERRSDRDFTNEKLSVDELSYLLWITQGVKKVIGDNIVTLRNVPSAGARHPFETYLLIQRVQGLEEGIYRYLPLTHQLIYLFSIEDVDRKLEAATIDQPFVSKGAVVFFWSCVPYRGEFVYSYTSHRMMLMDIGYVNQNLYLGAQSIGCGTCTVAAFNQELMDLFVHLDGEDEFILCIAPVGKV